MSKLYLTLNQSPRVILDVMSNVEQQAKVARGSRNRGCLVVFGLLVLGVPFFFLDMVMGYKSLTFSLVGGILWAAAFIVGLRSMTGRAKVESPQFSAARTIFETLKDDVGKKGRLIGWLDLTGPRQKAKIFRRGRTSSGKSKIYYRDPWLQAKAKLVDGTLLRLTLMEQLKVKKGYVAAREQRLKARLVVNQDLYRIRAFSQEEIQTHLPSARLDVQGGIINLAYATTERKVNPWDVLNNLKYLYSHLEPKAELSPSG
ncbi:MAG: hypothetical protein E3J21_14550 [Anaerolineales bacterium]|nr:MAG: hypothetical protein E3J21_14550 [Anaerolineales bacterium]